MATNHRSGKLAVILHADVAGSTKLVQQDEHLAHDRIQDAFRRFGDTIAKYQGRVRELRGDALLAEFERASDAVTAALAFQADHTDYISLLEDNLRPALRVGIAMGEVIIADSTLTGAGVVLAQRVEQLAQPGSVCITAAIHESLPQRMPFAQVNLTPNEEARQALVQTDNPEAYDAFLQGWSHYLQNMRGDFGKALGFFERAIELDPDYARAHAALAGTYIYAMDLGWQYRLHRCHAETLAEEHLRLAMKQPNSLAHRLET